MFLKKLQEIEKRSPLRQNPFLISSGVVTESTERWLRRFKWIRIKFPYFLHGEIL